MKKPAHTLTTVAVLLGVLVITILAKAQDQVNDNPRQSSVQWQWEAARQIQSSADQSNNVSEQLRQQLIGQENAATSKPEVTTEQLPNGMTKVLIPAHLMHTAIVRKTADGKFIISDIKGAANASSIVAQPANITSGQ